MIDDVCPLLIDDRVLRVPKCVRGDEPKNTIRKEAYALTFEPIQPWITSNTCLRLFSSIMKCPLPKTPLLSSGRFSALQPACFRNATWPSPLRPDFSPVT